MHIEIENGSFIFFAPYFLHPEYSTAVITNVRWDFCRNRNTDECNAAAVLLTGDFPSAIETLVTAVSLIRQSKIADSDPCKTLISSLQDTLQGLEQKSYETKLVFRFLQKTMCQFLSYLPSCLWYTLGTFQSIILWFFSSSWNSCPSSWLLRSLLTFVMKKLCRKTK